MSLTIADVIEKLKIPGTRFSGADWREGWPDRFYVNNEIVFNSDLKKVSPEEVAAYSEVTKKVYRGQMAAFQRDGVAMQSVGQGMRIDQSDTQATQ